jgi:hypothetical protein
MAENKQKWPAKTSKTTLQSQPMTNAEGFDDETA